MEHSISRWPITALAVVKVAGELALEGAHRAFKEAQWASAPGRLLGIEPPPGRGLGVVVVPPFVTRRELMMPLIEHWLEPAGYTVWHPNIPIQTECPWKTCETRIRPTVEKLVKKTGKRVVLIGWSKGGYEAAWMANRYPHLVGMAISIASPQANAWPAKQLHWVTCRQFSTCAFPAQATKLPENGETRIVNIEASRDVLVPKGRAVIRRNKHFHTVKGAGHLRVVLKPKLYRVIANELGSYIKREKRPRALAA